MTEADVVSIRWEYEAGAIRIETRTAETASTYVSRDFGVYRQELRQLELGGGKAEKPERNSGGALPMGRRLSIVSRPIQQTFCPLEHPFRGIWMVDTEVLNWKLWGNG